MSATNPEPPRTRFDNDPRVSPYRHEVTGSAGFTIATEDTIYVVLRSETYNWCIHTGPHLTLALIAGHGWAIGFTHADDAIGAVLGDPV